MRWSYVLARWVRGFRFLNDDVLAGVLLRGEDHRARWTGFHRTCESVPPFWNGLADPFVLHLAILYAWSIVVRYLPSLWHRVEDGDLDHVRTLLEYYLSIVDNVLPAIMYERVTGTRLHVAQPGGLDAPI